jgi:hypothetical protein
MCSYVVPGTGPSCVMSRHVLSDGSRWPVSDGVSQTLSSAGVVRLIVGHTPIGNCPMVIRSTTSGVSNPMATDVTDEGALTVFMCDTSYSNLSKIAGGGQRGKAVSELVVLSDTQTAVHGELETSDSISYVIGGPCGGDRHVGRAVSHQQTLSATKAAESSGPVYVAARLAKASSSKAYLLQRSSSLFTHEQWFVANGVVEDDVDTTSDGEQPPGTRRMCACETQ